MSFADTVMVSDYSNNVTQAVTAIGNLQRTLCIDQTATLSANTIIPENVLLVFSRDGLVQIGNYYLYIKSSVSAGLYQIFSYTGTGKVYFGPGRVDRVFPQWWGAEAESEDASSNTTAIQAALDSLQWAPDGSGSYRGGQVFLPVGRYEINAVIYIPSSIALVGESANKTIIVQTATAHGFRTKNTLSNGTIEWDNGVGILVKEITVTAEPSLRTSEKYGFDLVSEHGLRLNSVGIANFCHGINIHNTSGNYLLYCEFDHVTTVNCVAGLYMWGAGNENTLHKFRTSNCYVGVSLKNNDVSAPLTSWKITNCCFEGATDYSSSAGINVGYNGGSALTISDCYFEGFASAGILFEANSLYGTGAEIRMCYFHTVANDISIPTALGAFVRINGKGTASSAPSSGTWTRGQYVFNSAPANGAPVGWVCVTAGTPGTWLPFGVIYT